MKVYNSIKEFKKNPNAVVTTGTFDGVHVGHRKILERLKEVAARQKGETVILTFYPHPRLVLFPDDSTLKLLNTQEEKILLLEKYGVEHLIVHPFTKEFSRISSLEYVRDILVNSIGTRKLVIGYNHQFGRNREGSFEHLNEYSALYGFDVEEIPAHEMDSVSVSSTKIRKALELGDIKTANKYLGYEYMLTGTVMRGSSLGQTIGFPTANIHVNDRNKLIPGDGVYGVTVRLKDKIYNGMMNIGVRPTVNNQSRKSAEVHIFNFDLEIYDEIITVCFHNRVRDEKKFENINALKKQLEKDKNAVMKLLK